MTKIRMLSNGVRLTDSGAGYPVLLIHGISNFNQAWSAQREVLVERGFRVLVPDLPGHGRSAPLDQKTTVETLAQAMALLLDEMSIARTHVCGISLGGMVAMTLALRFPSRVNRLIVADSTASFNTDHHKKLTAQWRAQFLSKDGPRRRLASTWPMLVNERFSESEKGKDTYREWMVNAESASGSSYAYVCEGMNEYDIENELHDIVAPTCVIVGSEDRMLTPAHNQALARKIPGAQFSVIEGAAHLPNVDSSAQFNELMLNSLLN